MAGVADLVRGLPRGRRMEDLAARLVDIERERHGYRDPARRPFQRRPDGVACFNFMYLCVTEAVRDALERFEDPAFVERLAIVFAGFYLVAYDSARAGTWVSAAWQPLFSDCARRDVTPVQFALAGMNAHINNDLAWALLQTWDELGYTAGASSPRYRDFLRVNAVLDSVAHEVRSTLESGLLRFLDRLLGRMDDLVAGVAISDARTEAWRRGVRWRRGLDAEQAAAHERQVGHESRLILAL